MPKALTRFSGTISEGFVSPLSTVLTPVRRTPTSSSWVRRVRRTKTEFGILNSVEPNLVRLRRFALAAGLVLLTYALAVVELTEENIHPLGVPLRVRKPEWICVGLALVTVLPTQHDK